MKEPDIQDMTQGRLARVAWVTLVVLCLLILFSSLALAQNPSGADWFSQGQSRYNAKKWSDAINFFSKAIHDDPTNKDAYFYRGDALRQEGKILEAIKDLRIALEMDPEYSEAWRSLGKAYRNLGQIINIVAIDSMFDIGKSEDEVNSQSYLSNIILHQPNYLFNYANIGYQTYFTDQDALRLMKSLMFDTYRLGIVRHNLEEAEPVIRNADIVSVDISSVRFSDAPGNGNATPNGFYGEEICQIVRYAGLSDKLTSIGFYEVNPKLDINGQTSHLVAQMIWYFIDGFYNRAHDFPFRNEDDYMKYRVTIKDHKEELTFFKSKKTDRWWMEIPMQSEKRIKYQRHYLVPCSYQDYQMACNNDIPDRWWMVYQKMM